MIPYIGMMLAALLAGILGTLLLGERQSRTISSIFSGIAMLLAFAVLISGIQAGSLNFSENYIYYIAQFNTSFNLQLTPVSLALVLMSS